MHKAIGVFGAVSVATACVVPGSVTTNIARVTGTSSSRRLDVEHPTGFFTVEMEVRPDGQGITIQRAALLRTARKIMSGEAFIADTLWKGR